MATILIRDVPNEVHSALVAQAGQNRRSKEKHALFLIEGGLRQQRPAAQILAEATRQRAHCKRVTPINEILNWTGEAH